MNCDDLVAYVRFDTSDSTVAEAQLQFATTIFTCIILTTASLTFSNDTETIVIVPIQKQIGIIKTLADDPLRMPERPTIEEEEDIPDGGGGQKPDSNTTMRTIELEKTLFNIGNLLQMAYGRLGAIIIKENVSAGDGQPEIMIPGRKIDAIFMSIKINDFVVLADTLQEEINQYMNKII